MLGPVVRERVFDSFNNFNQRILGLLPETARSMLPFSFESENRTLRGILSRGGRELLIINLALTRLAPCRSIPKYAHLDPENHVAT